MLKKLVLNSREEWLKVRTSYIGGSDAACIVGMSPYKSNVDLWLEKTGRKMPEDISDKPYVQYGHDAEPLLRELFALDFPRYKVLYDENNLWVNDKYPFAHASLDGWLVEKDTGRKGIWECKTTNILQSMQKEKWKDQIPSNYYCQILHYMLVTEWDFVILKAQLKYDFDGKIMLQTKHYKIERSEVLDDIAYLEEQEEKFAEYIKKDVQPPLILPNVI